MSTKPAAVLFATLGETDLKVKLERGADEAGWGVFKGPDCRAFHEALLTNKLTWSVDWSETGNRRDAALGSDAWNIGAPLVLVAPKLAEFVAKVEATHAVVAAVLFATHRTPKRAPGEPVALGPVLSRALAAKLRLTEGRADGHVGDGVVGYVHLLVDDERTDPDRDDDVVHRRGVARGEAAIRALADALRGRAEARISTAGGMGEWKAPLTEALRFHWGEAKTRPVGSHPARVPAAESLRARGRVVASIERGDLTGAGALARSYEDNPAERWWTAPVTTLAEVAEGTLETAPAELSSLAPVVAPRPRCLLLAFRAEAALRAGRVAEAIQWTYGFNDAVVLDAFEAEYGTVHETLAETKLEFRDAAMKTAFLAKASKELQKSCGGVGPQFKIKVASLRDDLAACSTLAGLAPFRGASDVDVVRVAGKNYALRKIRNASTHSRLAAEIMKVAPAAFRDAGLWCERGGRWSFLATPLTRALFAGLATIPSGPWRSDPAAAFDAVLAEAVAFLRAPRP